MLASRTNATSKHEIELDRFANFVIGVRVVYLEFATEFSEFRSRVVVQLD